MEREGHDRLRQVPEESLDSRGDGLGLPLYRVVKVDPVSFPPVQAHRQQLSNLGEEGGVEDGSRMKDQYLIRIRSNLDVQGKDKKVIYTGC